MTSKLYRLLGIGLLAGLTLEVGCATDLGPNKAREATIALPETFGGEEEAKEAGPIAAAQQHWEIFFSDPKLRALINVALQGNQELNIRLQEIIIARAEVQAARGEYIPKVEGFAGAGLEKVGERTSQGKSDEAHGVQEHLPDFRFGLSASWEVDVWGRLRDAAQAADYRYMATVEARNFLITEIVAELADSYWDLVALDKQIELLQANIEIQQSALELVIAKKEAARATQLEVQRFEAEVLKNQGHIYELEQERILVENRINFLVGRFPQEVERDDSIFEAPAPDVVVTGLPSELLDNRPDVRSAAKMLEASKLDTEVAKARFYPAFSIDADVGYQSFNARHLLDTPESLAYNLVGNLVAPLLNRAEIEADYQSANARQFQAVFNYERTVLGAFTEVVNQLATIENLTQRNVRVGQQVDALREAIEMSNILYRSAHADYMEVLLTRRDLIEAQLELIETKKQLLQGFVDIYKALGGGWRKEEPNE
ncbi:MAG: efflux transporter outer membrane subunit [Planctomycetota bacterium]